MPTWAVPVFEQLWSFVAVAMAVYLFGNASKSVADHYGWRHYRGRDVKALLDQARAAGESSADVPLPADASWYDITLRLHPLVGGALFGLLPLPALHVIDKMFKEGDLSGGYAARCLWFMLAGALSGQIYELVKFAMTQGRARLLSLIGIAATSPSSKPTRSDPPAALRQPDPPIVPRASAAPSRTEPTEVVSTGNEDR